MSFTTICPKCKIVFRCKEWLVINDFHLHLCPECMQETKDKIVKELQERKC
jgi:ribosomal protein L36